jgi:predicted Fe-Mo cluster-binding NifX family protein
MNMKIAVPTKNTTVDEHFGHCESYTIFSIDTNNRIENSEILPSPQGCGCKSNIASLLQEKGVGVMLAGNMGNGALNVLHHHNIQVFRGCSGDVNQVVETYLKGNIKDSGEGCHHNGSHEEGHICNH